MIRVLFADDNVQVAEALKIHLRVAGFECVDWLPTADRLVEQARKTRPGVILVDLDMPGMSPFEAIADLAVKCPEVRCIVYTGYVGRDLIDRAVQVGAWGYVSKNDGEDVLADAIRRVAAGEFILSPEAREVSDR